MYIGHVATHAHTHSTTAHSTMGNYCTVTTGLCQLSSGKTNKHHSCGGCYQRCLGGERCGGRRCKGGGVGGVCVSALLVTDLATEGHPQELLSLSQDSRPCCWYHHPLPSTLVCHTQETWGGRESFYPYSLSLSLLLPLSLTIALPLSLSLILSPSPSFRSFLHPLSTHTRKHTDKITCVLYIYLRSCGP